MNTSQNDSNQGTFGGRDASGISLKSPKEALKPKDAPPPPKRSNRARHGFIVVMNFLMSCIVFVVLVLSGIVLWGKSEFEKPGPLQSDQTVLIKEGSSLDTIANQLADNGVIDGPWIFQNGVKAYRAQRQMKAGEYLFHSAMSMKDVMETIRSGKGILYKVSVPEGLTVAQVFDRLAKSEILEGDLPAEHPPEGSIMPDTYPFQRGTSRKEMLERMMTAQEKVVEEVWQRRVDGLPVQNKQEFVTLASIVEKETGVARERPHVASVFINRLRQGIRLQSDPTIIYGLFGGEGKPKDRPIYKSDIEKPTPYNTYVIPALPPGPIANPGRAALEAVANPSITDDLYFVADGTGGHVFAKTLEEHNQNVARWRAIEKQRQAEAEKKAQESADEENSESAGSNAETTGAQ
jgi:UPF0755 protein